MALQIVYQGPNGAVAVDEQQNTTVSADYDAVFSDYIITATGAGNFTITLPPANPSNGKTVVIKCLTTNPVTVNAQSGEFIDTVPSKTLINGEVLEVLSDGIKWVNTGSDVISGSKIINGTVTADKLASNSVTADKITNSSITGAKLAADSVTADKIATGAVGTTEISTSAEPTVSTIYSNNWFRSNGNSGWYNQTHGGGIFMDDSTWVKTYGGKNFYCSGIIRADGGFYLQPNPGGGSGDEASIRYFAQSFSEDTILEIRVQNDPNDRIALISPAATFSVGRTYSGSPDITARVGGGIEFEYASGTRYFRMQTDGNTVIYNNLGTALWASGTVGSDIKLKENIKNYNDSGIEVVKKLNVVSFNYIKEYEPAQLNRIGFIAQDVEKLIPQAIKSIGSNLESQTLLLYKEEIVPHLVKAIQEQQTQIESLEERIRKLEELIKS